MWHYENETRKQGHEIIAGIDEAGRGPLAGPVVAASVILPENCRVEGLNDSKKLSEKKRNLIFQIIRKKAVAIGIGITYENIIDQINILQAARAAMADSVSRLSCKPDFLLIDGNQKIPFIIPQLTIKKGDVLSASIAAASVIAKVTRDRMMLHYDGIYPQYGFSRHKGYGTQDHLKNISKFGPCKIHRKTFKGVKEYC
ncbi:MAG TPA: ribonuclease HII [Nitrospinota bacterium]|jgi:ribonuclease HII|nr:ribonuclease HII [Nitrospinota bacterium]HJN02380.1 ribonuclease HII [Nitrospinota bacterium]